VTLAPIDATNAVAVTDYLSKARDWLATAVEMTGPEQIAMAKAEIATAAEATKQLGLSKEIQLDAQEMVRRAEYALGKAIRKGQAEGTVATRKDSLIPGGPGALDVDHPDNEIKPRPVTDFAPRGELYGSQRATGVLDLADAGEADFDAAIDEAKAEGNLSRANVARKAREKAGQPAAKPRRPLTDAARDAGWDLRKTVERLQRIAADDRFAANAEQVTPHLRSHLAHAIEACQGLLDRINNN